jgi:hypothetical protein
MWFGFSGDDCLKKHRHVEIIGRITVNGINEWSLIPSDFTPAGGPGGITAGADGSSWFTDNPRSSEWSPAIGTIGRITTDGYITTYALPNPINSDPGAIAAGPDGALWFTELVANKIGRITTAGAMTEFNVPTPPGLITAGPDGALWFTEPFAQSPNDRAICQLLAEQIDRTLPEAENKIWHGHPVWFLEGNPIVGYSRLRNCVRLLFWSGQSFAEEVLKNEGSFQAAETRYTAADQVDTKDLRRWLAKGRDIQWDYKNIVRRKGRLERLK